MNTFPHTAFVREVSGSTLMLLVLFLTFIGSCTLISFCPGPLRDYLFRSIPAKNEVSFHCCFVRSLGCKTFWDRSFQLELHCDSNLRTKPSRHAPLLKISGRIFQEFLEIKNWKVSISAELPLKTNEQKSSRVAHLLKTSAMILRGCLRDFDFFF